MSNRMAIGTISSNAIANVSNPTTTAATAPPISMAAMIVAATLTNSDDRRGLSPCGPEGLLARFVSRSTCATPGSAYALSAYSPPELASKQRCASFHLGTDATTSIGSLTGSVSTADLDGEEFGGGTAGAPARPSRMSNRSLGHNSRVIAPSSMCTSGAETCAADRMEDLDSAVSKLWTT